MTGEGGTLSRRDRLRAELTAQIVRLAREQLAGGGPSAVSWRGIAKEVGMNPASLYTYVDGMDDLFTRVLLAAFGDLAAALDEVASRHADESPADRLLALSAAYRDWALANPQQFNLVFTDQIPGFAAEPGGPTVDAELGVFRPFVAALGDLVGHSFDPSTMGQVPLAERALLFSPFAMLHGYVMLEINHHAVGVDPDGTMAMHAVAGALAELERAVAGRS